MTEPKPPDRAESVTAARGLDWALDALRVLAHGLPGLAASEAVARVEAEGLRARVVDLDDPAGGWITADLQRDRVTLFLRASVVERATAG